MQYQIVKRVSDDADTLLSASDPDTHKLANLFDFPNYGLQCF